MTRKASPPSLPSSQIFPDAGADTAQRLLASALQEFAAKGFHASTTRAIGEGAGMSPAGVYVHYASKADLLFALAQTGHRDCLRAIEEALADAAENPEDRVRRLVEAFALWHAKHQPLARVSQYELSALSAKQLKQIVVLRQQFDEHLRREFRDGVETGTFEIENINGTATAVLSLCIDLARWYEPRSSHKPSDIARLYGELVLRTLRPPAPLPDTRMAGPATKPA